MISCRGFLIYVEKHVWSLNLKYLSAGFCCDFNEKKKKISNRRICYHLHVIEAGLSTKLLFNFVVSSQLCHVEYRKEICVFFKLIYSIYKMPVFIPFLSLPNQKFQTHFFKNLVNLVAILIKSNLPLILSGILNILLFIYSTAMTS